MHRGAWKCTEVCGGMQKCTDGCMERLVKVYKGTQGAQRYAGCTEVHIGMCRGAWRCTRGAQRLANIHSSVLKCMEECIGLQRVHRGMLRYTEVAEGCAEVHRGVCRGWGGAWMGMWMCRGAWTGVQWYMKVYRGA